MDKELIANLSQLSVIIAAVGALGTTAFGLVDTLKVLPGGGLSRVGFGYVRQALKKVAAADPLLDMTCLCPASLEETLEAHWINGVDTQTQIDTAKSLIKLRLTAVTAQALATATSVDPGVLTQVAVNLREGLPLTPEQTEAYARFDQVLDSLFDQAYQRADQCYRNVSKFSAIPIAVGLAMLGAELMPGHLTAAQAALVGLLATPIAPVAKDLTSLIGSAGKPASDS